MDHHGRFYLMEQAGNVCAINTDGVSKGVIRLAPLTVRPPPTNSLYRAVSSSPRAVHVPLQQEYNDGGDATPPPALLPWWKQSCIDDFQANVVIRMMLVFMISTVALSWACAGTMFARVTPSNCDLQLFAQSPTLNAHSQNISNWYFQDWGFFINKGFCPLESYVYVTVTGYTLNDGGYTHTYKELQNCSSWESSVWKDWDTENESNGLGKTNFQPGAAVWSSFVYVAIPHGIFGLFVVFIAFCCCGIYTGKYSSCIGILAPLYAISFLAWVCFLWLLLGTDQLDPAALQKNFFPSCNVSIDKLYNGSGIIFLIWIVILGGLNFSIYVCWKCRRLRSIR